jgi:methyl coenzyme M reductase subunit C
MKHLISATLILFAIVAFGQKKQMVEFHGNIVEKAIAELDSVLVAPDGVLYKKLAESGITGNYIFDITIREKGFVATVFIVNDGENSIPMQNRLKDIIKAYRFSFRVPKEKSYKFQYTFNL